jgi:hypothetical protein
VNKLDEKIEFKKVYGIIDSLEAKQKSTGEKFYKIGVEGRNYNWFSLECNLKMGDYVEGTFSEVVNPNNKMYPFKNIKTLEIKPKPEGYKKEEESTEYDPDEELKTAKIQAAILVGSMLEKCETPEAALEQLRKWTEDETYNKIINSCFYRGKKIRSELIKE